MSFQRFLPALAPHGSLLRLGCVVGTAMALAACGYKGPLYLPPPPPAPQESLTTPPSGTVTPSVGEPLATPSSESPETPDAVVPSR